DTMLRTEVPSLLTAIDWPMAINRLEGAYSENTLRSYRADFALFEGWCDSAQRPALPASPETVAEFITQQARHSAPATLRRRLFSIRKVHRLLHLENPVEDEEVAIAMRRVLRTKARRQKQALGLTSDLRDKLISACPDTLAGLRDRAMLAVGYDTLCRRSELVSLCMEDLTPLAGGACSILVRRAKNDPFGDGRYGYLSPPTVKALDTWLKAAGIKTGWLFRKVVNDKVGPNALHPYSVNRIIKGAASRAGMDDEAIRNLSG